MTMDCDRARELLEALLDGRLEEAELSDVRVHTHNCEKCGKALESLTMLKTSLRDPRLYYPAPEALRRKVEALAAPARPRVSRSWLPIAAAIAVSVAATWMVMVLRSNEPSYETA